MTCPKTRIARWLVVSLLRALRREDAAYWSRPCGALVYPDWQRGAPLNREEGMRVGPWTRNLPRVRISGDADELVLTWSQEYAIGPRDYDTDCRARMDAIAEAFGEITGLPARVRLSEHSACWDLVLDDDNELTAADVAVGVAHLEDTHATP